MSECLSHLHSGDYESAMVVHVVKVPGRCAGTVQVSKSVCGVASRLEDAGGFALDRNADLLNESELLEGLRHLSTDLRDAR